MTNIRKHIGTRIRQIRASKKATQAEMAKEVGVSPATVSGWEIGDFGISLETAIRVAKFGEVSLDWLLKDRSPAQNNDPKDGLTPEEQRLLESFQRLSKTSQTAVLRVTEMMQK
jgi:transcriptional regulator with XRE-family HTH domain